MGRGRIPMELIKKEKNRETTFKKRKDGLLKKFNEFSILCDVEAAAIIYAPNSAEPETWSWPPEDPSKFHHVIQKYQNTTSDRRAKMFGVHEYFDDRIKKVEGEISKLYKNKMKVMYPEWDASLNNLGEEQLRIMINFLDAKLDACNARMNMLKGKEVAESIPPFLAPDQNSYLNYLMMQNMNPIGDSYNTFQIGESSQPASMLQLMGNDVVTGDDPRTGGVLEVKEYGEAEANNQIQNMNPAGYYDGNYIQAMQQQHALSSENLHDQGAYQTLTDYPLYDEFYQPNGLYDTDMQLQAQIFNYMHGRK